MQRKLNSYLVERRVWEPTTGNIELPTNRRSSKWKKQAKTKLIPQGKANFESDTNMFNKKPHDDSLGVVHKIVSHSAHFVHAGKTSKAPMKKKKSRRNTFQDWLKYLTIRSCSQGIILAKVTASSMVYSKDLKSLVLRF